MPRKNSEKIKIEFDPQSEEEEENGKQEEETNEAIRGPQEEEETSGSQATASEREPSPRQAKPTRSNRSERELNCDSENANTKSETKEKDNKVVYLTSSQAEALGYSKKTGKPKREMSEAQKRNIEKLIEYNRKHRWNKKEPAKKQPLKVKEEDKKEYLRAGLLGSVNGLFIAGDIIDSVIRQALRLRVWDLELPVMTIADGVNKAISNLTADDMTTEDVWQAIDGLAEASNSFGIPAEQSLRVGQGISDIMNDDYKRGILQILGWSPYYIDEKKDTTTKNFFSPGGTTKTQNFFSPE